LQLTDVMSPQRKIVGKISRTAAMRFMKDQGAFEQGCFQPEHVRAKRGQLYGELFEQGLIKSSHGGRTPVQSVEMGTEMILPSACYSQMK
jgi:hypothetical protein